MEWEIAHLDRAILMPVGEVPGRVNELNTADEIVVYCKTGVRSARITNFLRELGFRKVKNLVGGIDEWGKSRTRNASILRRPGRQRHFVHSRYVAAMPLDPGTVHRFAMLE